MRTYTHAHIHIHTHTHTHTHTHIHTHSHPYMHHTLSLSLSLSLTHTHTHLRAHTHTHTETCFWIHVYTRTHINASFCLSVDMSCCVCICVHTHAHTHTHTYIRKRTHTHIQSHTHKRTHTHTHTHTVVWGSTGRPRQGLGSYVTELGCRTQWKKKRGCVLLGSSFRNSWAQWFSGIGSIKQINSHRPEDAGQRTYLCTGESNTATGSQPPDPMNHAKKIKGWSPWHASFELVPQWYKTFPPDHLGRLEMKKPTRFSNKMITAWYCGGWDFGAKNPRDKILNTCTER